MSGTQRRPPVTAHRDTVAEQIRTDKQFERQHPLEFDRNGFPVAQPTPSFFTRVARLRSVS